MARYEIPEINLERLEAEIEKLAKKAEKLDLAPPTLEVVGEFVREEAKSFDPYSLDYNEKILRKYFNVEINGEAPRLKGWRLIAVLDHVSSGTRGVNVLRRLPLFDDEPEVDLPKSFRTDDDRCDHCETKRFRNDTFALQNTDTGAWKVVGRKCLRDFLGHRNPERIADWLSYFGALLRDAVSPEWLEGGSREVSYLDTPNYLANVAAVIEANGWLSKTKAREQDRAGESTANGATLNMYPPEGEKAGWLAEVTDDHKATADEVLDYLRAVLAPRDNLNDYEWNLVAATTEDYTLWKNAGLIASAVWIYKLKDVTEREENGDRPVSEFQGEVSERQDWTLTVINRLDYDTQFGTTRLTLMEDEAGNKFVWSATNVSLDVGQTYTLAGTVKAHEMYKGIRQTRLTRCRVLEFANRKLMDKAQQKDWEKDWTCPLCKATVSKNQLWCTNADCLIKTGRFDEAEEDVVDAEVV